MYFKERVTGFEFYPYLSPVVIAGQLLFPERIAALTYLCWFFGACRYPYPSFAQVKHIVFLLSTFPYRYFFFLAFCSSMNLEQCWNFHGVLISFVFFLIIPILLQLSCQAVKSL